MPNRVLQTFRQPRLAVIFLFFILTFGKCLLYSSVSRLWNRSKACWVSVALLISSQLVVLIAWQNSSLFLREYNLLHIWVSTSVICILTETWIIGKWFDTSVMNNPWMEWLISSKYFVKILSINVADVAGTLIGREMRGRNTLLDIISTKWAVCTWLA